MLCIMLTVTESDESDHDKIENISGELDDDYDETRSRNDAKKQMAYKNSIECYEKIPIICLEILELHKSLLKNYDCW